MKPATSRSETIDGLGEFGLLARLEPLLGRARAGLRLRVLAPWGDDAFVFRSGKNTSVVLTTDILVEDVHFSRAWASPADIGYKSIAVNVSDIAAMGDCRPVAVLIGLALPAGTLVNVVDKLFTGIMKACGQYDITIAGGDIVKSKKGIVISISLYGETKSSSVVMRSGAKPGDLILCTGTFGDSGLGLNILQTKGRASSTSQRVLTQRQLRPRARLREAQALHRTGAVTAMTDASDGLAVSVDILSKRSQCGAEIDCEHIPRSRAFLSEAARRGLDSDEAALFGGEDYELVCTARPGQIDRLLAVCPELTVVGRMVRGRGLRFMRGGAAIVPRGGAFEHFA